MRYRQLGRTNLEVSLAAFGTGGPSGAGQRTGSTTAESVALIHAALDHGVNLIDSAERYRTEQIVGQALQSRARDAVLISTKGGVRENGRRRAAEGISSALRESLKRLGTDYIDIYHLHAVSSHDYGYARDVLLPALVTCRDKGIIRAVGITEAFAADTRHEMLRLAVADGCWDVIMAGFNVLNQSARTTVLGPARDLGIGVLGMFAVRRALSDGARLCEVLSLLARDGYPYGSAAQQDPVTWLIGDSDACSLTELAYRFAVHEPGITSVLFGTGNRRHLDSNIDALLGAPLPKKTTARLRSLFADVAHLSGN